MIKKNVLLVINTPLVNAGVPNVIMTLVRKLSEQYLFDVLSFSEVRGYHDDEFQSYGGEIYRVKVVDYEKHKVSYPFRLVQIRHILNEILLAKHYDVIHCHCGIDAGICLSMAKKQGVEHRISHAHGIYTRRGKNVILRAYNRYNKRLIVDNATACLACSELAGQTLFGGAKFSNILNPVDTKYYGEVKKKPHGDLRLLQIGYFCSNKNQLFSVKLVEELKKRGQDVQLFFIGYPSELDYLQSIKTYIADHDLVEDILFLPPDANKQEAFGEVDYSLVPSKSEGLPLVALESQAAGVRCLLSANVPQDADVGYASFLGHDNVQDWADYIMKNKHNIGQLRKDDDFSWISEDAYSSRVSKYYEA